MGRGPR